MSNITKVYVLFLITSLLTACSSGNERQGSSATLVARISNVSGGKLYLQELIDKTWLSIDSATHYTNSATFVVNRTESNYYRLIDSAGNMGLIILNPGEKATVEGDLKDAVNTFQSLDSKDNQIYFEFYRTISHIRENEELWVKSYRTYMESPSTEDSATHYMTLIRDMQDSSDAYVKHAIDNVMPSFTVYVMVNYLRIEKEFDYMYALATRIKKEMPDSKYARLYISEINRMKAYKDEQFLKETKGKASIGKTAPDFTLNDREGKPVSLSSFKGKYVLIDFWASWCGPCRAESEHMVEIYNKYKSKNFEIIGVSLDGSEKLWSKAIQKDGLTWIHVSDLLQWDSPVVALYEIEGIPATVIVDPKGIIVAKNLRGDELDEKLSELIK